MRLRGASFRDYEVINSIYSRSNFALDSNHLQRLVVVEDDEGIIAIGCLSTILEGTFLTDENRSKRARVNALNTLMQQIDIELQNTEYDHVNVFVTNPSILNILKRKFNFVKTKALEVLVRGQNGKV